MVNKKNERIVTRSVRQANNDGEASYRIFLFLNNHSTLNELDGVNSYSKK